MAMNQGKKDLSFTLLAEAVYSWINLADFFWYLYKRENKVTNMKVKEMKIWTPPN